MVFASNIIISEEDYLNELEPHTVIFLPNIKHFENDDYLEKLKNCSRIIFTDFFNIDRCIHYDCDGRCHNQVYYGSKFNDTILIPNTIKYLKFGEQFNKIIDFPNSLTHIIFGRYFNQIIQFPQSLQYLKFGEKFNQIVEFPQLLEYLNFGDDFNQIVEFPQSLKYLIFGEKFNQQVILPNSLIEITYGKNFNNLVEFPASLNKLYIDNYNFNKQINLPENLTNLTIISSHIGQIIFPQKLIYLKFISINYNNNRNQNMNLPNNITHLNIDINNSTYSLILPDSVKFLILGSHIKRIERIPPIEYLYLNCNNIKILEELPDGLIKLIMGTSFNSPLNDLPSSIKKLVILNKEFNKNIANLPDAIEELHFNHFFSQKLTKIPSKLKKITCSNKCCRVNNLHLFHDKNLIVNKSKTIVANNINPEDQFNFEDFDKY